MDISHLHCRRCTLKRPLWWRRQSASFGVRYAWVQIQLSYLITLWPWSPHNLIHYCRKMAQCGHGCINLSHRRLWSFSISFLNPDLPSSLPISMLCFLCRSASRERICKSKTCGEFYVPPYKLIHSDAHNKNRSDGPPCPYRSRQNLLRTPFHTFGHSYAFLRCLQSPRALLFYQPSLTPVFSFNCILIPCCSLVVVFSSL